jgi:cyclophilin family peptidyl-prolyl cis-trans isomerase
MKRNFLIILLTLLSINLFAAKPKNAYVKISTNYGEVYVKLYNQTPKHRDNFIKLVNEGTLNGTLFHRVIQEFMTQGGDPDSKNAKPGEQLGNGDLGYTIPAEFVPDLFHKKGALAAARNNNPEKASSACQFYLVQGKVFTDKELDDTETNRMNGRKIPQAQREVYKTIGGTPHLDQNYTVFGEIVKGIIMVDNICTVKIDGNNRPLTDIKMTLSLVEKKELKNLIKEIGD